MCYYSEDDKKRKLMCYTILRAVNASLLRRLLPSALRAPVLDLRVAHCSAIRTAVGTH